MGASAQVCDNIPVLRQANINQGLPLHPLVRGKEVQARFYLSKPSCSLAGTKVSITSASLAVSGGSSSGQLLALNNYSTAAPVYGFNEVFSTGTPSKLLLPDVTSHPQFEVRGTYTNSSSAMGFNLSFTLNIGYKIGTSTGSTSFAAVTAPVERATSPLRVLTVPMGNPALARDTQFSPTARTTTLDGYNALNRIFPTADGAGSIPAGNAGLRYSLSPGMVDISQFTDPNFGFCGGTGSMPHIAARLDNFMVVHNANNLVDNRVEKVQGIVDEVLAPGCLDGMANLNASESWAKAIAPKTNLDGSTTHSRTGAVMAMEIAHNLGAVPAIRDDAVDVTHSQYLDGDLAGQPIFVDRGYDLLNNAFLSDDRNVMRVDNNDGKWNNYTTILDPLDWPMILCRLGGPLTTDCNAPAAETTAIAVAIAVLVGTTNGTPAGTEVHDSFVGEGPADAPDGDSTLRLVQRLGVGGPILSNLGVPRHRDHDSHGVTDPNGAGSSERDSFAIAFPSEANATRLELWDGAPDAGTLLYARNRNNAPTVASFRAVSGGSGGESETIRSEDVFPIALSEKITFDPPDEPRSEFEVLDGDEYIDEGVTFVDALNSEYMIRRPEDCSDGCRVAPANSEPFVLDLSPTADPAGYADAIQISFSPPVSMFGMYLGNGEIAPSPMARITAQGGASFVHVAQARLPDSASPVTFLGVDAKEDIIERVRIEYLDEIDDPDGTFFIPSFRIEEMDTLMWARGTGGGGGAETYTTTTTAIDDNPGDLRAEFLAACPGGVNSPLAVGVKPTATAGVTATWVHNLDLSDACAAGGEATLLTRVNDGFTQSAPVVETVQVTDEGPQAAISAPTGTTDVLQHEAISLHGLAHDDTDGSLGGGSLEWFLSGPGRPERPVGTGGNVTVAAPSGGWTPGVYTARLVATDSTGATSEDTATVRVLEDKDNDGVIASKEGCAGGNDTDPFDAYADADADGVPNGGDEDPCTPRSVYDGIGNFDPDTVHLFSSGNSVTMFIEVPQRNLSQIAASTVRIRQIGGQDVSANPNFVATHWRVIGSTASAKFDRAALEAYLDTHGYTNQPVRIAVGGRSLLPAWSFEVEDTPVTKKT